MVPRRLSSADLAQLTDDNAGTTANDDVIADVLTEASAVVDSYCRLRYAVPLQSSEQVKGTDARHCGLQAVRAAPADAR
jgi:phage gp36-like protein